MSLPIAPTIQGSAERRFSAVSASVTCAVYPSGICFPRHAHDTASITLIASGELDEEHSLGTVRAGPGHIVVKPAGTPHANAYGPSPVTALVLEPDRAGLFSEAIGRLRYEWSTSPRLARPLFGLLKYLQHVEYARNRCEDPEALVADVLGALPVAPSPVPSAPPRWLADVEHFIEARLPSHPRLSEIASLVGVHPVHVSRVFHRFREQGVVEFTQSLRVRHAARLLTTTDLDIASIALRVGCCDQAHLCRLFAARWGVAPAQYRRLARRLKPGRRNATG